MGGLRDTVTGEESCSVGMTAHPAAESDAREQSGLVVSGHRWGWGSCRSCQGRWASLAPVFPLPHNGPVPAGTDLEKHRAAEPRVLAAVLIWTAIPLFLLLMVWAALHSSPYLISYGPAVLLASAAALLLTRAGFVLGRRAPLRRAAGVILVAAATWALTGVAGASWWLQERAELAVVDSPSGQLRARVVLGHAMIDPLYIVKVSQADGFVRREWTVACMNENNPRNVFEMLRWTGAGGIQVTTDAGRPYTAVVDRLTGEPVKTIHAGC